MLRALVTTERECNGKSVGSVDDGRPVPTSRIAADLKRSREATLAILARLDAGDYIERSTAAGHARKRMRAKLREIKQQLRQRMHDPLRQTGQWLKSVVQGHFNYYAVPGYLASLGVFRDRALVHWWRTLRHRSQKRRINWTRTLVLATRWLPQPRTLHPFPDARFAATHPR